MSDRDVRKTVDRRIVLRREILEDVRSIEPLDDLEAEHQRDAIEWIESGAELCRQVKPATPPKHLVSYFVLTDDDHFLLVEHRNAGLWLPTGGHVEPDERPSETARREAKEELGIEPGFSQRSRYSSPQRKLLEGQGTH